MGSFFFLNPSARGARFIGGRYHPWSFCWIRAHHFVADEEMVEGGEREQIGGGSAAVQQELGGEAILPPLKGFRATPGGWLYFRGFSFEWFPSFSPAIPFYFIRCDSIDSREANCRHLQSFRSMLGFCRLHLDSRKQMNLRAEDQRGKTRSSKEHQW